MHSWHPEEVKEEVAHDVYKGYELKMAQKLFSKIPIGTYEFEDVLAYMRIYALEAIELYDPNNRAKFTTFLYKHLSIRCMQWFNWAWLKKTYPAGGYIASFSAFEALQGNDSNIAFDPTRVESNTVENLEVTELSENLSPLSRNILEKALMILDDELIKAFQVANHKLLSRLLMFSEEQIHHFIVEIKRVAPTCIGVLGNG